MLATEMRNLALKSKTQQVDREVSYLLHIIRCAARNGVTAMSHDTLLPETIQFLTDNGFKVEKETVIGSHPYYIISW